MINDHDDEEEDQVRITSKIIKTSFHIKVQVQVVQVQVVQVQLIKHFCSCSTSLLQLQVSPRRESEKLICNFGRLSQIHKFTCTRTV